MALPTLREHVPTPEEKQNKTKQTKTKPEEQSN
jgi:hypothetical protein